MNQPLSKISASSRRSRRGVALIIVLASVTLLLVLLAVFLGGVGNEVRTTKMYANGSSAKLLAQSAVNIVEAEIGDATHDQTLCWASQPGMIRTYDTSGKPQKFYKLYSDDSMVGSGVFDYTQTLVPANWYGQKGVYVDLNEPINVGASGTSTDPYLYPIVDGYSGDLVSYPNAITTGAKGLGPMTNGQPQVLGFWLNSSTPVDTTSADQAPMPVKWLYILQNGLVVPPDSGSGENGGPVTFNNAGSAPSPSNPIVARIAFWTDDETCKVNINTASESAPAAAVKAATSLTGSYIDTPRVCTAFDEAMSIYPAVQNEFQRYPGHPATVSLSSVFQNWTADPNYPESIYPLTPRINDGGSVEGTVQYASQTNTTKAALKLRSDRLYATPDEFLFQPYPVSSTRITNAVATGANPSGTVQNLSTSGTGLSSFDETALEKAKFFITACSRAPDVNLFNLPRVSMWPISSVAGTNNRTPYDDLIAFCETVGYNPPTDNFTDLYYFQRGDALTGGTGTGWQSQTEFSDIRRNTTLLNYLLYLGGQPIPGFGNTIPATGNSGGSASTFAAKYSTNSPAGSGSDLDQILMEIFDYIRCTNLHDSSQITSPPTAGGFHYFSNTQSTATANNTIATDDGLVMPSISTSRGTKGFGRFPTVSGAGMIFIAAAVGPTAPANANPPGTNANDVMAQALDGTDSLSTTASEPTLNPTYTRVQAALVFSLFDPSQGFYGEMPNVILAVTPNPANPLEWDATGAMAPMYFGQATTTSNGVRADGTNTYYLRGKNPNSAVNPPWGGELGVRFIADNYGSGTAYPLATPLPFTLKASPNAPVSSGTTYGLLPDYAPGTKIHFQGSVTVKVYLSSNTSSTLGLTAANLGSNVIGGPIQTMTFTFPPAASGFPLPTAPAGAAQNGTITYNSVSTSINSFNNTSVPVYGPPPSGSIKVVTSLTSTPGRLYAASTAQYPYIIVDGDTVQSLVSASGDLRLAAAQQTINAAGSGSFMAHPLYGVAQMAHSFVESNGLVFYGATRGQYIPNLTQYWVGGVPSTGTYYTYSPFSANTDPTLVYTSAASSCEPEGFGLSPTTLSSNSTTFGVFAGPYQATSGAPGDWDNGTGVVRDGPYINKADEGQVGAATGTSGASLTYPGYFSDLYNSTGRAQGAAGAAYFSPARQIPSAGMLGSLPTGVFANRPWQTLLFHPDYTGSHLGGQSPPDYLLLDFFHMPVVEPYAISEPLSTAGRINMNYLMVPFTYINRDTGLRAVLQSQQMLSIPNTAAFNTTGAGNNGYTSNSTAVAGAYKQLCSANNFSPNFFKTAASTYRFSINADQTLLGFQDRFFGKISGSPDIFRSPAEICSLDLVPNDTGADHGVMQAYWNSHALTGDNSREKPYANIYPLLTTKSNTFTVHYRVQILKKLTTPSSIASQWVEGTDVVSSEYRGSQTIERYIDPNDTRLTEDYASDVGGTAGLGSIPSGTLTTLVTKPLPTLYKFRVVSSSQFAP